MFQKIVREHPILREHWHTLLEKGFIENSKGCIVLVREPVTEERVLVIRDAKNGILFSIKVGRLDVTRGSNTIRPTTYTFRVGDMGKLDPEHLEEAFDSYEGFEASIRDLYRSLDRIISEHKKTLGVKYRVKDWFRNSNNRWFLLAAVLYGLLTVFLTLH